MAIQVRRGSCTDFDPTKMLPGEWAVSTDPEIENQMVWMCFAPGVVKQMVTSDGAVTDEQIAEAVTKYLAENPVQSGATAEQVEQINKNTEDIGNLSKEIDGIKENGTGGGASGTYRKLGVTPYTTDEVLDIKLTCDTESSFTAQTPTVAEWDSNKATYSKCEYTEEDGFMVLKSTADTTAWHQNLAKCVVEGLTIGEQYKLIVDASNTPETEENKYAGHFYVYDANSTLINPSAIKMYKYGELYGIAQSSTYYNERVTVAEFTAPTESIRINWYPHNSNNFVAGKVSESRISGLYINRISDETNRHTEIFNLTGTCDGEVVLGEIPAYTTITGESEVNLYARTNIQDIVDEVIVSHDEDTGETKVTIPNLMYENKQLEGKQIVCFGDSLIGMYRNETSATAHIANVTGATVHNVGFGGCRMSKHPISGYAEFSMCELAKAIVDNDWTSQDSAVKNGGSYFPEQLEKLKAIDFNDVDIAVIHYGTNDYASAVSLEGDESTDCATVCGALRYTIETLLASYPRLRIYISLPVFRYWTSDDGTVIYPNTYVNGLGKTLIDYIETMREVAKEYNLPVIDGYHGMGINDANASVFFEDGTHHNMVGRELFGTYIGSKILANSGDGSVANGNVSNIPETLPNPHALTFTGAVTGTYDGSEPLEVEIPSGGSADAVYMYRNTVAVEEAVNGITVELPVPISNFHSLNFHLSFPNLETQFALYTRCGNAYYKSWGNIPAAATGTSGANLYFVEQYAGFKSTQISDNAYPVMPSTSYRPDRNNITFYSNTSGVSFPPNSRIRIEGVYRK